MLKKLSVGAWITLVACVMSLASLIVYSSNIASEGYFKGASVTNLVLFSILAMVAFILAIVLKMINADGTAAKCLDIVSGLCQIAAPVLLAANLINLIAARVEGLGFIYFSNADVALEVQTPENLASASGSITAMVLFGVAMLIAIIAAFCSLRKKNT